MLASIWPLIGLFATLLAAYFFGILWLAGYYRDLPKQEFPLSAHSPEDTEIHSRMDLKPWASAPRVRDAAGENTYATQAR